MNKIKFFYALLIGMLTVLISGVGVYAAADSQRATYSIEVDELQGDVLPAQTDTDYSHVKTGDGYEGWVALVGLLTGCVLLYSERRDRKVESNNGIS